MRNRRPTIRHGFAILCRLLVTAAGPIFILPQSALKGMRRSRISIWRPPSRRKGLWCAAGAAGCKVWLPLVPEPSPPFPTTSPPTQHRERELVELQHILEGRGLGPELARAVRRSTATVPCAAVSPLQPRASHPLRMSLSQAAEAMTNKNAVEAHAREELGLNVHALSNPLRAAFVGEPSIIPVSRHHLHPPPRRQKRVSFSARKRDAAHPANNASSSRAPVCLAAGRRLRRFMAQGAAASALALRCRSCRLHSSTTPLTASRAASRPRWSHLLSLAVSLGTSVRARAVH